ncbi:MAG: HTH domain-containing protein [Kiritimatiellae bacterium]|nr:HTH domain-containing protein [Kiritimatiellia bacterium]
MTSTPANVTVGQEALVKIAGRIIPVRVEAVLPDGWMVRSATSGKIFKTKKLHEQPANEAAAPESEPASESAEAQVAEQPEAPAAVTEPQPAAELPETEPATEPATEPVPEAPRARKMSLLDAAIEVLKLEAKALNTREMVKLAIERGLWIKTACKTPEQSLYGAIFREIASKEVPRIVKAEVRGKFKLNPAAFADEPEA